MNVTKTIINTPPFQHLFGPLLNTRCGDMNLECTEPPKQPHTFKALPTDAPLKTYLAFVKSQNALSYDELKSALMKLMSEHKKLPLSLLVMHALAGDQDIRLHEDGTDTKQLGEAVKKHVRHTLDQQNGVILSQEQIQILENGVKTDWLNALSAAQLSSLHNHLEEAIREQNDKVSSFLLENILEPSEEPQITAQKKGFELMIKEPLFQQMLKKLDSSKPLSEWKTFFTTQEGEHFLQKLSALHVHNTLFTQIPLQKISSVGRRMGIDIIETCEPLLFFAALARNISKEQIKPLIKKLYTLVNPASKMPIIERNDPYFNQITPCNNMMKYIPPTHSFIVASKGPGEAPAAIITSAQDHQNKINMIRDDIEKKSHFLFATQDKVAWMRSDPKQIEYAQIHTIDGEVTRQAAPIIQRFFETNEVLPIKKFINLTHKINSGTMHGEAYQKNMEELKRLVLDMHDNNLDDSYKTVIELATHVVDTIKQTALNSTDTEVDLEASLEAPLKALEDECQRLDRHIRYSLFKGATCQTFSSIALTYLVNEQNRRLNSPLDIYSAQRNIIYQLNAERDDGTVFMDRIFKYGLISDLSIKDQLEALYGMGLSRNPDEWPLLIKMTYSELINDDAIKEPTDEQKTEISIANQSSS